MSLDRYWNNVPLLVPGSASPFVEARHGYTVTQGTTTVTFDSGVKPGAAWAGSAYFSGVTSGATGNDGTQLRLASSDDFTLGTGDFTIEAWIASDSAQPPADSGANELIPHTIIAREDTIGGSAGNWSLQLTTYRTKVPPDPDEISVTLAFYCVDHAAGSFLLESGTLPLGGTFDFTHVAVTRNGNEFQLWIAGEPNDRAISTPTIVSASAAIRIGNSISEKSNLGITQTFGRSFDGYIADVRITKGYARYTRTFTPAFDALQFAPPNGPLPDEDDTGDYTSSGVASTYQGATGAAGVGPDGPPEDGEEGGGVGISISLPDPTPQYDQRNETETRRIIQDALRRGSA